jgi:predicted transcriptional regulator
MDAIHQLGEASVNDVLDRLPDPPSYSAVRTMMRLLEEKGGPSLNWGLSCSPWRARC